MQDWESFESMLYSLSKLPGYKAKKGENKKSSPLISPAVYLPGTTRANKNVTQWAGWAAIDVDDHEFKGDLKNELYNRFGDWYYVCYSTASSTDSFPKFRLVFPLTKNVESSKIRHFWFALNTELESIGDRQTKDFSRMYYVPAQYPSANNFIFTNSGVFIDPDVLMEKHPYTEKLVIGNSFFDRLPEELQSKVISHRRNQLERRDDIQWKSYKDCPFVNKKIISEYMTISNTGWYHKLYTFMVSVAINAVKNNYPITSSEIEELCRQLDADTGNWYDKRPIRVESERAIEYAYRNV
jgi:hypothetical protein